MLVHPKEVLVSGPLWVTERANLHFIMQRRKGSKGKGFTSLFVGTIDSVRETKPTPYRILHQAEGSELFVLVSEAMTVSTSFGFDIFGTCLKKNNVCTFHKHFSLRRY